MEPLSCANYVIVLMWVCNSHASDDIQVAQHTSASTPLVSASQRDGDGRSGVPTYVSSPTVGDGYTERSTYAERNDNKTEYMVTHLGSNFDNTTDAVSTVADDCPVDDVTCATSSTAVDAPQEETLVVAVINRVQILVTCTGFLVNGATLFTLSSNGGRFSVLIVLLMKHQALVDMGTCGMGALYLLMPPGHWLVGSRVTDFVICYTWHSQGLFWADVFVSTWNLVLIGVERYIMICKLFLYSSVTKKHVYKTFAVVYFGSFVFMIPSYIQVKFIDGECLYETHFGVYGDHFYYGFSFVILLVFYLLPVGAFVFIYGHILVVLGKRMRSSTMAYSSVIDNANSLLTKTGAAITLVFVFTTGYDAIYYVLGMTGVVGYTFNSPLQKIGQLLAASNSVANPFVYVFLMPAFRDSLRKTFHLPTLRCDSANKNAVVEGSTYAAFVLDTATRGTGVATGDTIGREQTEIPTITTTHVRVEIAHIA